MWSLSESKRWLRLLLFLESNNIFLTWRARWFVTQNHLERRPWKLFWKGQAFKYLAGDWRNNFSATFYHRLFLKKKLLRSKYWNEAGEGYQLKQLVIKVLLKPAGRKVKTFFHWENLLCNFLLVFHRRKAAVVLSSLQAANVLFKNSHFSHLNNACSCLCFLKELWLWFEHKRII